MVLLVLLVLLFGAVIFISGTDKDKLREFINKNFKGYERI